MTPNPQHQEPSAREIDTDLKAVQDAIGAWIRDGDGTKTTVQDRFLISADHVIENTRKRLDALVLNAYEKGLDSGRKEHDAEDAERERRIEEAVKKIDTKLAEIDRELDADTRIVIPEVAVSLGGAKAGLKFARALLTKALPDEGAT